MSLEDLKDKLDKPEGQQIWSQLSRPQKLQLLSQYVPESSNTKLKDKFEFMDHLDNYVKTGITTPKTEPKGYPSPQYSDNPPAGAEVPVEQRLANNLQKVGEGMGVGVLGGLGASGVASFASKVKNALSAPSVSESYSSLTETLAKHGINPGVSEITENTPKAIADYAKTTKALLKLGANKGREFLSDVETEAINTPSKLERIREDVTRIFNNKWESPNTQVGRDLAQIKDTASKQLSSQIPEVGEALKTVKSAYDKEKLLDAITKSAKVLGTAALGGLGLKSGMNLAQKVVAPFGGNE